MFENLVSSYYAEEELDNAFLNKIGECFHRAKAFMTYEEKQILQDTHSFHDWYLIECRVYCEKKCKEMQDCLIEGIYGVSTVSIWNYFIFDLWRIGI